MPQDETFSVSLWKRSYPQKVDRFQQDFNRFSGVFGGCFVWVMSRSLTKTEAKMACKSKGKGKGKKGGK